MNFPVIFIQIRPSGDFIVHKMRCAGEIASKVKI